MSGLVRGMAVMILFLLPWNAQAFGWRHRAAATAYYCCPTSVVYVPTFRVIAYEPVLTYVLPSLTCAAVTPTSVPSQVFATPTPAPPSAGPAAPAAPMPPAGSPPTAPPPQAPPAAPGVSESRTYYDAYKVAPRESDQTREGRCSVGFWNLSDHDLQVAIDGQLRTLPRGKNLTLDLNREFVWMVQGRQAQKEQVPANEAALEIVIKR